MTFRITLQQIANAEINTKDVYENAATNSLAALYALTTVVWHHGDIAVIASGDDQGSYVYRGSDQTTAGVTVADDWAGLTLPTDSVVSVAGLEGTVTAAQLRAPGALNVADGANATPAHGLYLDPTTGTAGQVAKLAGGAWTIAADNADATAISLKGSQDATEVAITATGHVAGTPAVMGVATASAAGIATRTNYMDWTAKLTSIALSTESGVYEFAAGTTPGLLSLNDANVFDGITSNSIALHHSLNYNGLVLRFGTDYTRAANFLLNIQSQAGNAMAVLGGTLGLENTVVTTATT